MTDGQSRSYPIDESNPEEKVDERMWINGVPVNPDGTIDIEYISGSTGGDGDSFWVEDADGNLTPEEDQPLSVEESVTKREPVFNVKAWGAVGDGSTNDREAIRAAADAASEVGGKVYFPPGDYGVDGGGTVPDGAGYCISLPGNVVYDLDPGATIVNIGSPNQHCVYFNGVDDWRVTGGGTIDGGQHDPDHTVGDYDNERAHAIAVGYKTKIGTAPDTSTGCRNWKIDNITVTGGHRHGIETGGGTELGLFESIHFTDAAGDDPISISGDTENVWAVNCRAVNHVRDIGHTVASFEIDDGPKYCGFQNCVSIGSPENGFTIGKTHGGSTQTNKHNYAINCFAFESGTNGFAIDGVAEGPVEHIECINCWSIDAGSNGFRFAGGGGTIRDVKFTNCRAINPSTFGVFVSGTGSTVEGMTIDVLTQGSGQQGIRVNPGSESTYSGLRIEGGIKDAGNDGLTIEGATSNYEGRNWIEGLKVENSNWANYTFDSDDLRQFWVTRENEWDPSDGGDELSPAVPANPVEGLWYLDDGTNTSSGTAGKRVYLGGSWIDAYTA